MYTDYYDYDMDKIIADVALSNVRRPRLPRTGGSWQDEAGDSMWIPDDDHIVKINGRETTMAQLKDMYDFDGIEYNGGEPDFSPFEDEMLGSVSLDDFSSSRTGPDGTYTMALTEISHRLDIPEDEISDYMKANNLTFHECQDRHTVEFIPADINGAFPHTGGIGVQKAVEAMADSWQEDYDARLALERDNPFTEYDNDEFLQARDDASRRYRSKL